MKHLDELTMLRMVDGELSAAREQTTRRHLLDCARCRASYEVAKAETEVLRAALREEESPIPDGVRAGPDLSWLAVAAVALAVLGLSAFWNGFVEPMFEGMDDMGLDGASLFTTVLIRGALWRGWSDMASTVFQGVAALVAILTAGSALVWGWRRWRSERVALCLTLLVALAASAPSASAAVIELDRESYVLREGETVDNDLVVAGERVLIEGIVTGDLIVLARYVEVTGEVRGDILGLAEEIDVTGRVGGSVRTGSRSLALGGLIDRNVTAAGETIRLRDDGRVGGSFASASREALLSGPVERDLLLAAEIQELNGHFGGSALLAAERLRIGPEAAIEGDVTYYGHEEPEISPEARLASELRFEHVEHEEESTVAGRVSSFVFFWAAAFVLGAAMMLLAPGTGQALRTAYLPDYGKSLLVGVLSSLLAVTVAVFLCITLIGLPLGLTILFLWGFGVYVAQAYVGLYLGARILGAPTDTSQLVGRLALGLFVIHLAKALPILGGLVSLAVAIWGFGALTLWALEQLPSRGGPPRVPVEASA